jgi:hypothetical protein
MSWRSVSNSVPKTTRRAAFSTGAEHQAKSRSGDAHDDQRLAAVPFIGSLGEIEPLACEVLIGALRLGITRRLGALGAFLRPSPVPLAYAHVPALSIAASGGAVSAAYDIEVSGGTDERLWQSTC